MDGHSADPKNDAKLLENAAVPTPPRRVWETPALEELAVRLSASEPRVGGDGGVYADCTKS